VIAESVTSNEPSAGRIGTGLPTRVITYAWGKQYVDILLSLTIPALLARGNLPYIAALTRCELVILTEERFFATVSAHPSVIRAKKFCFVRLISLDDLIAHKDKYGMALTFALHRGFSDLGAAMTESWQIFLNADFVLAEDSLRSVICRLAQGERLVASPSYCVDAAPVIAQLRERIADGTGALAIPSRDLAAITLAHRHNTIRGKTVNKPEFTLRYIDQFYWLVDDGTLLGHQMPIAIVGMRPERHVVEPNSYWDHGLMKEYCPDAGMCVLGDSDEFLMVELREKEVAQELIESGRPSPKIIAERMISFLTPYQRDCARHSLVLHSGEIPPQASIARQKLRTYVDEVLSHLPAFLPSHINHPQWNYHRPDFIETRHKYLSERLGSFTELLSPPLSLSDVDRAWWKLDSMEKRAARTLFQLKDFIDRELHLLHEAADGLKHAGDISGANTRAEFESKLVAASNRIAPQRSLITQRLEKYFSREGLLLVGSGLVHLEQPLLEPHSECCSTLQDPEHRQQISKLIHDLSELYQLATQLFDIELQMLRSDYHLALPRRVTSAAVPFVKAEEVSGAEVQFRSVLRKLSRALLQNFLRRAFGLAPLIEILTAAAEKGPLHVLRVGSASGLTGTAVDYVRGSHVWVSTAGMKTGNFGAAFMIRPSFDLCICDLDFAEVLEFPSLIAAIRPFMTAGGTIVSYHFNQTTVELPADSLLSVGLAPQDTVRIYRTGSRAISKYLFATRQYTRLLALPVSIGLDLIATSIMLLSARLKVAQAQKLAAAAEFRRSVVIEVVVT
jgi:hypothetical protein